MIILKAWSCRKFTYEFAENTKNNLEKKLFGDKKG